MPIPTGGNEKSVVGTNGKTYIAYTTDMGEIHLKEIDAKCSRAPSRDVTLSRFNCDYADEHIAELGGIDLQLLGIGLDGHIGFNEPDKYFVKSTHVVDLHESTIKANSRFFASEDEVPKKAITMGMVSIMQAKKILLIASGKEKRDILEKAFYGPITPEIPASILQLHPDITVIYSEN